MVVDDPNVTAPVPKFKLFVPVKVKLFIVIAGAGDKVIEDVASIVVPDAMVKVPAEPPLPPKAAALPTFNVPAVCDTPPVKVLALEIVHEPASCLVTLPEPVPKILVNVPPWAPPNVKLNPAPVIVPTLDIAIVPVPPIIEEDAASDNKPLYVTATPEFIKAPLFEIPVPASESDSAVPRVNPFKSNDAPEETVVLAAVVPKGPFGEVPATPSFNVPERIFVAPEYVLAAFVSITALFVAPVFTICKGLAPLIKPETVKVPDVASPDVPM